MAAMRINWIDWAKTIGIYCVILGHVLDKSITIEYQLTKLIYMWHMPLFFFLSGFLCKKVEGSFRSELFRNMKTLLVPYLFLNIVVVFLQIPKIGTDVKLYVNELIGVLTMDSYRLGAPTWFLVALFEVRIVNFYYQKFSVPLKAVVIIGTVLLAYFLPASDSYFKLDTALAAFPFFILGYYCNKYSFFDNIRHCRALTAIALLLVMYYFMNCHQIPDINLRSFGTREYLYYPVSIASVYLVSVFCIHFCKNSSSVLRLFSSGCIVVMAFHLVTYSYFLDIVLFFDMKLVTQSILWKVLSSMAVMSLLYYPIKLLQEKIPFLLGNRTSKGSLRT